MVDAAAHGGADPFAGQGEAVLVRHQQEGQVILPQIAVEAVYRGQVEQALHLGVNAAGEGRIVRRAAFPVAEDVRQTGENRVLSQVGEEQKVRCFAVHMILLS